MSMFVPELPGRLLYAKLWGSRSHNTHLPDSDWDYLYVYAATAEEMLSIDKPQDTIERNDPDFQAHEVEKFCRLLLKGNPSMIEMLFTESNQIETEEWRSLRAMNRRFLSHNAVRQYIGYGKGQLQRLMNGGRLHTSGGKYNTKWAYHLVRVLQDALKIAQGEEPVIWKTGAERDGLMHIREGGFTIDGIADKANRLLYEIDLAKPWKCVEEPDKEALNEWLLDIRRMEP